MSEPFSPEDQALLASLARRIVERRMGTPAILFLESVKPLNFLGSQAMVFLAPVVTAVVSPAQWERLSKLLERRDAIEALIVAIENQMSEA